MKKNLQFSLMSKHLPFLLNILSFVMSLVRSHSSLYLELYIFVAIVEFKTKSQSLESENSDGCVIICLCRSHTVTFHDTLLTKVSEKKNSMLKMNTAFVKFSASQNILNCCWHVIEIPNKEHNQAESHFYCQ